MVRRLRVAIKNPVLLLGDLPQLIRGLPDLPSLGSIAFIPFLFVDIPLGFPKVRRNPSKSACDKVSSTSGSSSAQRGIV